MSFRASGGHEYEAKRERRGALARIGDTNVEVPDVEAALAKAESLGGKRTMGPDQVPGGPVIGLFQDLDGHTVGVAQA
jgi:predicted enzyme related to lactoylglutathione lyase